MPELDTEHREELKKDQFAYVDSSGAGHLPINDEAHIRNAMARWNQTKFEGKGDAERARRKILGAAKEHGIDVDPESHIAKGKHEVG